MNQSSQHDVHTPFELAVDIHVTGLQERRAVGREVLELKAAVQHSIPHSAVVCAEQLSINNHCCRTVRPLRFIAGVNICRIHFCINIPLSPRRQVEIDAMSTHYLHLVRLLRRCRAAECVVAIWLSVCPLALSTTLYRTVLVEPISDASFVVVQAWTAAAAVIAHPHHVRHVHTSRSQTQRAAASRTQSIAQEMEYRRTAGRTPDTDAQLGAGATAYDSASDSDEGEEHPEDDPSADEEGRTKRTSRPHQRGCLTPTTSLSLPALPTRQWCCPATELAQSWATSAASSPIRSSI